MALRILLPLLFVATALGKAALFLGLDGPVSVDGVSHLAIVTTLTNTGDENLTILNDPQTVLSNLATDSFIIENVDGTSPDFIGYIVKYNANQAVASGQQDAFSVLKPGESVKVTHHLGQAYNFKGTGVGAYSVRARAAFRYRNPNTGELLAIEAHTEAHSFSIFLHVGDPVNAMNLNFQRRANYLGCTDDRQRILGNVISRAEAYARDTYGFLRQSGASGSNRYSAWFGQFSQSNFNTVVSHFQKLDAADFGSFTYDCGSCPSQPGVIAYISGVQNSHIYLCDGFWDLNFDNSDSQSGTLVSLASQFPSVVGTTDLTVGKSACRELAELTPLLALKNAASHQYFAENSPPL